MTPEQLKQAAIEMFGERGWAVALANRLQVGYVQVWRWVNARTPVPGPVSVAVTCLLEKHRAANTNSSGNTKRT